MMNLIYKYHWHNFYREILKERLDSCKTQEKIAEKMHAKKSAVRRFKNFGGKKKHSLTFETFRKYAKALNCELRIQFFLERNKGRLKNLRKNL